MSLASASSFAPEMNSIYDWLLVSSTFLTLLVWGLIAYFCVKYRKRSKAERSEAPTRSPHLEAAIAGMILLFGLAIFFVSAKLFYKMSSPPANAVEIDLIAKQWMWVFHDPRGPDQINILKIPLSQPVRLLMTSEDVIHSFFIPDFRVKQDILPGRYTSVWFEPTKLGTFPILCSQYCGLSHSQMRGWVQVVTPGEFEDFLHQQQNPHLAAGADLYIKHGCASCHEGTSSIGPSLRGLYGHAVTLADGTRVTADENYLRRSILDPNADITQGYKAVMPTFQGQLSESQLMALIQFIKKR